MHRSSAPPNQQARPPRTQHRRGLARHPRGPRTSLGATMSDHRPLHDTTASHAPPDDFRPADAIESLRAAILRVDTMSQVACHAADELSYPDDAAEGRALQRVQILVEQAADEASTALAQG